MFVLFSSHKTIGGAFIRAMSLSRWNHVDMVFADGTMIGATTSGVMKLSVEGRMSDSTLKHYQVSRIELPDEQAARDYAEAQVGKPYDWTGCVGTVLRGSKWQDESKWFCSELVAKVCEVGGLPVISPQKPVYRVSPGRLDWSPALKVVHNPTFPLRGA